MTKEIILVTGGCKSGKSRFALEVAEKISGSRIFIATCRPDDAEMEERIARHKQERSSSWQTLEVPVKIADAISETGEAAEVILIDCLTLWLNNLFGENSDISFIEESVDALIQVLQRASCTVVLVANEVGMGIVPENTLARKFRDMAGTINQRIAGVADRVFWTVAGIPMQIKGQKY